MSTPTQAAGQQQLAQNYLADPGHFRDRATFDRNMAALPQDARTQVIGALQASETVIHTNLSLYEPDPSPRRQGESGDAYNERVDRFNEGQTTRIATNRPYQGRRVELDHAKASLPPGQQGLIHLLSQADFTDSNKRQAQEYAKNLSKAARTSEKIISSGIDTQPSAYQLNEQVRAYAVMSQIITAFDREKHISAKNSPAAGVSRASENAKHHADPQHKDGWLRTRERTMREEKLAARKRGAPHTDKEVYIAFMEYDENGKNVEPEIAEGLERVMKKRGIAPEEMHVVKMIKKGDPPLQPQNPVRLEEDLAAMTDRSTLRCLAHSAPAGFGPSLRAGNLYDMLNKHGFTANCHVSWYGCNAAGADVAPDGHRLQGHEYVPGYVRDQSGKVVFQDVHHNDEVHPLPKKEQGFHSSFLRDWAQIAGLHGQDLHIAGRTQYVSVQSGLKSGQKTTSIELHPSLADNLKGLGAQHHAPGTKVHVTYDRPKHTDDPQVTAALHTYDKKIKGL